MISYQKQQHCSNTKIRRITCQMNDIKLINKKSPQIFQILSQNQYQSAIFIFSGHIGSPYEGYWFRIKVQWIGDYPFTIPKYTILDRIWNPYVDWDTNKICIDILEKPHYSAALTTYNIIISIVSLLGETKIHEGHDGFANPQAAIQMWRNRDYYYQHTKQLCETYSYKREYIYKDQMRGSQQQPIIHAVGKDLKGLISQDLESKKFHKKQKNQVKNEQNNLNDKEELVVKQNEYFMIIDEGIIQYKFQSLNINSGNQMQEQSPQMD